MNVVFVHWSPTTQLPAPAHDESANDSPPALPFGPHVDAHEAPACWQMYWHVRMVGKSWEHAVRNAPGARQEPVVHVWLPLHVLQVTPPAPHSAVVVPA